MNISIILGHPSPDSFNHALAAVALAASRTAGHDVRFHDLHAEKFDPVLPAGEEAAMASVPPIIALHCRELVDADGIVVIHPNWWGMPPAILTGWIDRVLRPRVAYRFQDGDSGQGAPIGLLRARSAVVFNTSNTRPEREARVFGDPLDRIWKDCIFGLCGVPRVERHTFSVVVTSTLAERHAWLAKAEEIVARHFPKAS
jgi:putative NADPH-quinone reductase